MTRKREIPGDKPPNGGNKRKILLVSAGQDLVAHLSSLNQTDWEVVKREAWSGENKADLTIVDGHIGEACLERDPASSLTLFLGDSPPHGLKNNLGFLWLSRDQFLRSDVSLLLGLLGEFGATLNYIRYLESKFRPFLRQAQLGAALQGLVHNVNNQLTSIMGLLELIHQETPPSKDMVTLYEQFLRLHADFANLLRVSRRDIAKEVSSFDLNALICEELRLLTGSDPVLREKVLCKTELDTNLPAFHGIYSDFSHSFVNLVRNALNAMENAPSPQLTIRTGQTAKNIWLEVKDQGIGIPERFIEDIFKPYVSHRPQSGKHEGTGLGLGLYTSRELLNKYGVEWNVESQEGEGTRFTLNFPKEKVCQPPKS